jgi:beta-lactamase class A
MPQLTRRAAVLGGLAATLAGCGTNPPPPPVPPAPTPRGQAELAALEAKFGGRLGVFAVDTGNGGTVQHRADERFLMCSTHKLLAVAAILRLSEQQPGLLDKVIHYDRAQLLPHAPDTSQHVSDGMTVSALCESAITVSDNTAANLLGASWVARRP